MNSLRIIAGPDSLNEYNIEDCYKIADVMVNGDRAIYGVRTVGLKSRTNLDKSNSDANYMGHDLEQILENMDVFGYGGSRDDLIQLPTVLMAKELHKATGVMCATEILCHYIQLACIAREFAGKPFMPWNPAIDQSGWNLRIIAGFANEYGWTLGIKNGKWLGEEFFVAEDPLFEGKTSIETAWEGLLNYAQPAPEKVLIQRGCDLPSKGQYRNLPIHNSARRTKFRNPGVSLFFDPSHALGPLMRDKIVEETVKACNIVFQNASGEYEYLYDGVLLEVVEEVNKGKVLCDTFQHITIAELQMFVDIISEFRTIEATPRFYEMNYDLSKEIIR
jgi:hypothetical protein